GASMSAPELRFLSPQIQRRRFWSSGQRMEKNFRENFINRKTPPGAIPAWENSAMWRSGELIRFLTMTLLPGLIWSWERSLMTEEIGQVICLTDIPSRRPIILNSTVRKALAPALWETRYLRA